MKRCAQCWRYKPLEEFAGARDPDRSVSWCSGCRAFYRSGQRQETRRQELNQPGPLRFSFVRHSQNAKLGPIPSSMSSGWTCPDACRLKDSGCYGEFGLLAEHWRQLSRGGGLAPEAFLAQVAQLPKGTLWRHNVVGDLPGLNNELDQLMLARLVVANRGRRGHTFTAKPLGKGVWAALWESTAQGFVTNISCHGLEHLDTLSRRAQVGPGYGARLPAAVVLPEDAPDVLTSPGGVPVMVCPAETAQKKTCATCGLCARADRPYAIGFRAHGQWRQRVTALVQLKGKANGSRELGGAG